MIKSLFFLISVIYIILFFLFCLFTQIQNVKVTKKQLIGMFFLLNLALCVIAFFSTDNSDGWDLNRYYDGIDDLRGKSFKYALQYGMYKETVLANLLFFIVSRTSNNAWLQVFSTSISFGILSYILIDRKEKKGNALSTILFYFFCFFGVISFSTVLLGVRWILAMSFTALALYLEQEKHKKITGYVCYAVSVLFHYGVFLFIIVRVISFIKFSFIKYLLLFFTLLVPYVGEFFQNNPLLSLAYQKLQLYTGMSIGDIRVWMVYLGYLLLFAIIEIIGSKKLKNTTNYIGQNFIASVIGSVGIPHLLTRSIGLYYYAFSGSIIDVLEDKKNKYIRWILFILSLGMYAYQFVFIKTYWRVTFL